MKLTPRSVQESGPIIILGAGLSGLSLADALTAGGCRSPIVLVDRRRHWDNDRTWSTWLTGPLAYAGLARHRWWSWSASRGGRVHVAHTRAHPYIHLEASAVYEDVLQRLDAHPRVEIRAGEPVRAVHGGGGAVTVTTSRETLEADLVIDAMGVRSPLLARDPTGSGALQQRFLGWEVHTGSAVFDPHVATLMDLRGGDRDGVAFFYVLPFDESRALVEHTTIGRGVGPDAAGRRDALRREMDGLCEGGDWHVAREEVGVIPMSSRRFPSRHPSGVITAGGAAGAVRPSSGYAFTRIQRHTAALAAAILGGGVSAGVGCAPLPAADGHGRLAALDRVFLAALRDAADGGESLFWQLTHRTPADVFARFMTDAGSLSDEARIAAALAPSAPAMLRGLVGAANAARRRPW